MKPNAGLSLLEICIALIIIGLIMTPIIESYKQQVIDGNISNTTQNLSSVDTALKNYYIANNSLPCPADPTRSEATGPNAAGKTYGQSDCTTSVSPLDPTILTGSVPFVDLHLPATQTYDGWNIKIAYTVTKADIPPGPVPSDATAKAITVDTFDSGGNPATPISAFYFLASYGVDGLGGYTSSGTLYGACPTAATLESENCNKDHVFIDPTNKFSTASTINKLDDLVQYSQSLLANIWTYVPKGQSGSSGYKDIFTADYIGIGYPATSSYVAPTPLDVNGNIRTEGASSSATLAKVCDQTGNNNCFPPAMIAGAGIGAGPSDPATTLCQNGTVNGQAVITPMTAIKNANAACTVQSAVLAGHGGSCSPGYFVTKITGSGGFTCCMPGGAPCENH